MSCVCVLHTNTHTWATNNWEIKFGMKWCKINWNNTKQKRMDEWMEKKRNRLYLLLWSSWIWMINHFMWKIHNGYLNNVFRMNFHRNAQWSSRIIGNPETTEYRTHFSGHIFMIFTQTPTEKEIEIEKNLINILCEMLCTMPPHSEVSNRTFLLYLYEYGLAGPHTHTLFSPFSIRINMVSFIFNGSFYVTHHEARIVSLNTNLACAII